MLQSQHGRIEVICGSMFSGKTEELMRRVKRAQFARQKVQIFKPVIDNRYGVEHVQSHDARRAEAIPVANAREILTHLEDRCRIVGIDEAQFLDAEIVEVATRLANRGVRVIVAGLDMDFRGLPFGPMPSLMAVAEDVTKLSAVCMGCGAPASRSQRLAADQQSTVMVGAADLYEARCRQCHEPEGLSQAGLRSAAPAGTTGPSTVEARA
ncbi:MAG: thymidine kinase [Bdellovibrionales bacterium]|nr:thymidine kinase [Bdellovibrionales bacterium]